MINHANNDKIENDTNNVKIENDTNNVIHIKNKKIIKTKSNHKKVLNKKLI